MKQVKFGNALRMFTLSAGLLLSASAFAQSITVKGNVKDETGEPVLGATVRVVGQKNGAVTDLDGNFSIAADAKSELEISYVGYETVKIQAQPNLLVQLKNESQTLNDVVVIGYGVAKKNDLTGSVTAIKPDEKNRPLVSSAQEMMQGKIAGVNVTTSNGGPGGGATIRVRGGSSLNANNDPLIVIDGMAMDNQGVKGAPNALAMVNPNDIESFTVLKDASATAIYGSRGSNGVIIITTKKGRGNAAPKVSYSGNVSMSMLANKFDVLNGDEYRDFVNSYYGADSDAAKLLGTANTDWQDEIYRTAISTDHNVTVTGGVKGMPFRASLGYTDQNGILKTSNYQRYTASLNLSPSFFEDHLKVNANGKFMYAKTRYANNDAVGAALRMDPTQVVRSDDPRFVNYNGYTAWTQVTDDKSPLPKDTYPTFANTNAPSNPVALLNEKNDRANSYDFLGNVEVDYKVHGFEDLRLHANASGDWANGKQKTDMADWGPSNFYWGNSGFTKENKYNLALSTYAQYYKDFSKTQHFDIMGGYEWTHVKYWGNNFYRDTRTEMGKSADQIAALTDKDYNSYKKEEWKQEYYIVSFFGRLNYIAFDRYMLTATIRRDGSSRFSENNRWGLFPSAALAWTISNEPFMKATENVLSKLKLRLGYGVTGQQEIGDYQYITSYSFSTNPNTTYLGTTLLKPNGYSPDLKWEQTTTYNVAIDFGFLNNRINGSIEYYQKHTKDLLNTISAAAGTNFINLITANVGKMKNKGVEANVNAIAIQSKDFTWEVGYNITWNDSKITKLTTTFNPDYQGIDAGTNQKHQVGEMPGTFYLYQQVYDENGKPIQNAFVDRNNDGQITEADRYLTHKSPMAKVYMGFSSQFSYKKWDLGFNLRANFGNYVYNGVASGNSTSNNYGGKGFITNLYNGFQDTCFTLLNTSEQMASDYFLENASFLKMDNLTLGYSFQNLFAAKLSGRISASVQNVFTISKYSGLDPECGAIDSNIWPRPRTYTIGLNLNF